LRDVPKGVRNCLVRDRTARDERVGETSCFTGGPVAKRRWQKARGGKVGKKNVKGGATET